ncbi:hypothetical protein [Mesorhizobium sp. KR2-14]|uniref:hypothetical protein n=1 Tax=Mesorhizobium sp. KR2-14 TaxID=3156610 RepID=UPI0032B5A7A4
MFYPFAKGPEAPSEPPSRVARRLSSGTSLHERKLAAWALAIGARVPLEQPSEGRRRRGSLPDIDLSGAGPDPGYRSPIRRLTDWLGALARPAVPTATPDMTVSGTACDGVGAKAQPYYTGQAGIAAAGDSASTGEEMQEDACERPLQHAA